MKKEANLKTQTLNINVFDEIGNENIFDSIPSRFCRITPDMATVWLERSKENFINRPLNIATVRKYTKDIIEGKWQPNGEPIIFDTDGKAINGQHRLHAIINANKPIISLVVCGVDTDCFKTMDSGRLRQVKDLFFTMGVKNPAQVSGIVTNYASLLRNKAIASSKGDLNLKAGGSIGNKNLMLIETYEQAPKMFQEVAAYVLHLDRERGELRKSIGLSTSNIGAYIIYLMRDKGYSFDDVKSFWNDFLALTPAEVKPHPTVIKVREFMRKAKANVDTQLNPTQMQNCVVTAWNCKKNNKRLRSITTTAAEKLMFE